MILIGLIFVGAAVQKFTGKVALNCECWSYSRHWPQDIGSEHSMNEPRRSGR